MGNLTRKKDVRTIAVPDSIIVGDRAKTEYENSLDNRQQQAGGFETPADSGTMTNFVVETRSGGSAHIILHVT